MTPTKTPVTQRSLFSWVWSGNAKLQMILLAIIAIAVFSRVLPLEMQKRIVNKAIRMNNFELLIQYCSIYLGAVILAGGLKYAIAYLQTVISQQVLARMRKGLYEHILTLPLNFFRKTQPGVVINALITELTTSGNFAGMAIASPITNLLTLLAFAGYLFWLNWALALISLSIYPMAMALIPVLQKRANQANKRRVDTTRKMSDKIAEAIGGIHEIQGAGAFAIERGKFDALVQKLEKIRLTWTLYSQGVKVTNNFFSRLGPFLIFIVGGYMTMKGRLELGALVAFLSAQESLYDPWKELIEFYQVYQDSSVSYRRTMGYFNMPSEIQVAPVGREPYQLEGGVEVNNLSFATDTGIELLKNISFTVAPGEHMALVGFSGSGKSTLAQCMAQLYRYTGGSVKIGDHEVNDLSKQDVVRNLGFVPQTPFIFKGSIEENLLYAFNAMDADQPPPSLDDKIALLHQTGLFTDVLRFGLDSSLERDSHGDLAEHLVRVRGNFQRDHGVQLAAYVEFFDENRYLNYSSIMENLTFGNPNQPKFEGEALVRQPFFRAFLRETALQDELLALGAELARQTVDILGDLPPDAVFFEQSPIPAEEIGEYKDIVAQMATLPVAELAEDLRTKLLGLGLRFTRGVHKVVGLSPQLEQKILAGRKIFHDQIGASQPEAFTFYNRAEYIYGQSILNNIFFGKTTTRSTEAQEAINQCIIQLLIEEELLEQILAIGMLYDVGTRGDKLSGGQRQKLEIARVLLKRPPVLILDEAISSLDNKAQARIQRLLETRWRGKSTVIAVVHGADAIKSFNRVAVMKAGKIVEMGDYEELIARKGFLYELEFGRQ